MQVLFHPDSKDFQLSNVLSSLSDPIRLGIVARLGYEDREFTCGELQPEGMAKSTVSHHFKILREAGVIRTRVEGTRRFVSLRSKELESCFPGLLRTLLEIARTTKPR